MRRLLALVVLAGVCFGISGCSSDEVDPNAPPPKKPGSIPPPSNLPPGMFKPRPGSGK